MSTRKPPARSSAWVAALGLALPVLVAVTAAPAGASPYADEEPEAVDVLELSPEIERFIDARVPRGMPRTARVRGLMDALFGRDGLDIAYGSNETQTAIETFESRTGNCLSFTILFVALAKHVGLKAHFLEVSEILSWDRRGDVAVSNRHMFAEVETAEGPLQVDFLPGVEKRYRRVRRVGEQRVLAHYYSNLGADALTDDRLDLAMELLAKALEADDTLAAAWVNLGVTQRRRGDPGAAEASYLRSLELNPDEISAASNLAGLYRTTDRDRKARPYMKQVRKHRRRNPFFHLSKGLDAANEGDLRTARRSLKRAVRLIPDDVMFRVELGKVQYRSDRPRKAERSFEKALGLAASEAEKKRVHRWLERLRAGPA